MYYKNLIGQRFGKWVVLEAVPRRGHPKLRCRCECGRVVDVDSYSLYHGVTTHCGKCNTYSDEGTHMKCIMADGSFFIFDKDDFMAVKNYTWSVARGYARTVHGGKNLLLHKLIAQIDEQFQVDHINQNKLDNRRLNLRAATHGQNQWNRGRRRDNTSGFKGVCFDKRRGLYMAYINANHQRQYLGYFISPRQAALAYNQAAADLHGEFACLNRIGDTT